MAYSSITKPSLNFNTVTYTGNASTNAITGVGFQPDLIWGKDRGGDRHWWADAVRGKSGTGYYLLASNNDEAQTGNYPPDGVTTIGSDGFTLGANASNDNGGWSNEINQNSGTYVAWNWKAGGGQGSANSDGTFATTYTSANQTTGFSISQFTVSGSGNVSFGHGLGAKPKVVITKSTSHTTNWNFYHEDTSASPENDYLYLNSNAAKASATDVWGDGMTTSVVGLGVGIGVSVGRTYVAYCFAEKKGYSKFGSYTGNGNADGTFVYTGFKPAWVLIKDTTTGGGGHSWCLWDDKRSTFNPTTKLLLPDTSDSEYTLTDPIDFLSNGFKIRDTNGSRNDSSSAYIYMAFAAEPLVANVGASGVPATAR